MRRVGPHQRETVRHVELDAGANLLDRACPNLKDCNLYDIYGHAPAGSPLLPPPWYGPYLLRSKSRLNYTPPPVVLWPVVWFSSKL